MIPRVLSKENGLNIDKTPPWLHKTDESELITTFRPYEDVLQALYLQTSTIKPDDVVLSIGEGLSNFADTLAEETKATVLAVDPIYEMGEKILNQDEKQLQENIHQHYGTSTRLRNLVDNQKFATLQPEPPKRQRERMIAGSVYSLPFADSSADHIVAHRLLEHIVFPEALPELLRVLKADGELRLSGLGLYVFPRNDQPLLSQYELHFYNDQNFQASWVPKPGWDEQMKLLIEDPTLHTYVVSEPYSQDKPKHYFPDLHSGGTMIIRKDENMPQIEIGENTQVWRLRRDVEKLNNEYYRTFRLEKL